ncbi:MAG: LuxR C-terminal-related transcriptional regulator [Bacteroidales bacterium]
MKSRPFIVASSSYLLRKGLTGLLHRIPFARLKEEYESPEELERRLEHPGGEILLLDAGMLEAVHRWIGKNPTLLEQVLLVDWAPPKSTGSESDVTFRTDAGAPVLYLSDPKEILVEKIHRFLDESVDKEEEASGHILTPRERTILRQVSLGRTNKEIADQLYLSTHTVTTHCKNISNKLGIKSVSGLTIYAIVNNIITLEEASRKAE